ncbi:MAG: hypothetical protein WDZ77_02075 [Candidatus Pacearchaeota archaeon]
MKKLGVVFSIIVIFLMMGLVVAQSQEDTQKVKEIKEKAIEKGIPESDIESVEKVNLSELPNQVKLENIDDTTVSLYEVKQKNKTSFFIITSGSLSREIKKVPEIYASSFLVFGEGEITSESAFLKTSVGTESNLNKGYVMLRQGSIVGLSTNLEALQGQGEIQIRIYKNQELVEFSNSIGVSSAGIKKDYDIQSKGVVEFKPGDTISVYAENKNGVSITDITVLVEISNRI